MQKIHNNNNKNTMNTKTNTDTVYELAYSSNRAATGKYARAAIQNAGERMASFPGGDCCCCCAIDKPKAMANKGSVE